MKSIRFTEAIAWQRAHQLVLGIYEFTEHFPTAEKFALTAQVRKAAVSISANFVEGFRRFSPREKIRFYNMAQASGDETRYYLILAKDLGYGDAPELSLLLDETIALLDAYIRSLRKRAGTRVRPR